MATFDPGPITSARTFRFCCTGDGGTVYTSQFVVDPSTDCGAGGCAVTAQPTAVSGAVGDPVNFGGTASGSVQWQTSGSASGPWTDGTPPTTISASDDGTFWRFCCVDNTNVCSNSVSITVTTTSTCTITAQPSDVFGEVGDPVNFGGTASEGFQWETSGNSTGPWTDGTPPATITNANIGTFWRFCCLDDDTICSDVVTIIDSSVSPAMSRSDVDGVWDTTSPINPEEEFCVTNCGGAITWQLRVDDPVAGGNAWVDNQGWQDVAEWDGDNCVTLSAPNVTNLIESNPAVFDSQTMTGSTDLDHTVTFEIRGRCDGTVVNTYTVTVPYDHIDEGTLP